MPEGSPRRTEGNRLAVVVENGRIRTPYHKNQTDRRQAQGIGTYPWPGLLPMTRGHRLGYPVGSMRHGGPLARDRRHLTPPHGRLVGAAGFVVVGGMMGASARS